MKFSSVVSVNVRVCLCCRESEKTKLLISQQTQKVVEKEAETERIKAVIGRKENLSALMFRERPANYRLSVIFDDFFCRGREGGAGGRDQIRAEGHGEGN